MPVGRRYSILDWAEANDSIIIEDDYDSELRYSGMPVPALQGLDGGRRVVYIGSFSSTLFPAVRISYMVLPRSMAGIYETMKMNYDQTCSKTEQLTLALFMQRGFYNTNLRRIRNLYSHKLKKALEAISRYGGRDGFITADNTRSGINIILRMDISKAGICGSTDSETVLRETETELIKTAASLGIKVRDVGQTDIRDGGIYLIFYYNQIPIDRIEDSVAGMITEFRSCIGRQRQKNEKNDAVLY
jgi:GntR family transcriptional regulator/MocR family aminotransferase